MTDLTTDPALLRSALEAAILEPARRLLELGLPPEEITLQGDGFTVTVQRMYRCDNCASNGDVCAIIQKGASCSEWQPRGGGE